MKKNISTLSGIELHYAVAIADNRLNVHIKNGECLFQHGEGGPIVRWDESWFRAQILPRQLNSGRFKMYNPNGNFSVSHRGDKDCNAWYEGEEPHTGETIDIAAQRAFVAHCLGKEIDIPE
jgi:hypothetical protein